MGTLEVVVASVLVSTTVQDLYYEREERRVRGRGREGERETEGEGGKGVGG